MVNPSKSYTIRLATRSSSICNVYNPLYLWIQNLKHANGKPKNGLKIFETNRIDPWNVCGLRQTGKLHTV